MSLSQLADALDGFTHAVTNGADSITLAAAWEDLHTAYRRRVEQLHAKETSTFQQMADGLGRAFTSVLTDSKDTMTLADDIARWLNDFSSAPVWGAQNPIITEITAGLERDYVLIKRSDLPVVTTGSPAGHYFVNEQFYHRAGRFREIALEHLAIAEHQEAAESAARESEARLQARRNELARKLTGSSYTGYDDVNVHSQHFIDEHIVTQDAADGRDGGKA